MAVIRLPARRVRALEPIHRTTPRVGIFVQTQRARATGPQAHQHPYIADEERGVRGQVLDALGRFAVILLGLYCGLGVGRAVWHFVRGVL
jgi:hypothetical protein